MYKARGSMDLDSFTDMMNSLLARAWGENWGSFMIEEPTDDEESPAVFPMITFDTHERVRSKSHPSLDPILYEKIKDPREHQTQMKLYRMWFDVLVDFNIVHESNRNARILMEDFEDFLFTYKGVFKEYGISDMIFEKELKPTVVTRQQTTLSQRTLRYLVRIERITTIRSNTMNGIDIPLGEAVQESPEIASNLSSSVRLGQKSRSDAMMDAYRSQFSMKE